MWLWRRSTRNRRHAPSADNRRLATGLSEREHEVARLVAEGNSNREIADRLVVSPKTVERHLTNVLANLGMWNRTELASQVLSRSVRVSPDE